MSNSAETLAGADSARVYLCPVGVIHGEAAKAALADGRALPLLGARAAFTHAEIWRRAPGGFHRELVPARELGAFAGVVGARLQILLDNLTAAPPPVLGLPSGPLIMGVVNVTPDSFSDGGLFYDLDTAIAHGRRLAADGAEIVDVGGESTRPGSEPVPLEEELRRVLPVVRALAADGIRVSIDSRKAEVMRAAFEAGACMVNDISALTHDPEALAVAANSGLPVVLMHCLGDPRVMQDHPTYDHAAFDIFDYLGARIAACETAGIARERLLVDPGIGFGKTVAHNLLILQKLAVYAGLGVPIVLGVSRKSFIARIAGDLPARERVPGSLAAALYGLVQGARMLRVHDVAETRQALSIWQAIAG